MTIKCKITIQEISEMDENDIIRKMEPAHDDTITNSEIWQNIIHDCKIKPM